MEHKFIAVAYELRIVSENENGLVEKAPTDKPFTFISGFGMTLDDFEANLVNLEEGEKFDFTLEPERAYGEYVDARVLELDKEMFKINGHFDHENVHKGAIVPLQNEQGDRFMAQVVEIGDTTVTMDLNHPLAGKALNFTGTVIESREATEYEVNNLIKHLSGGCGCEDCNGCGHDHEGCNHDHEHDCGCGHCH